MPRLYFAHQVAILFNRVSGHLVEAVNYEQVVAMLESVASDTLSKRQAATELDTSRATINRTPEPR